MKFYPIIFLCSAFLFLFPKLSAGTSQTDNTTAQSNSPIKPQCEYKNNPKGISTPNPRLSWQLSAKDNERDILQIAYQIQVAEKISDLEKGKELLWDSGKQQSDQSIHVAYEGPKLDSRKQYHWRVKTWNNKNQESNWSKIAHWEMALLDTSEWVAQWIEPVLDEKENTYNPSPLLRKEVRLNNTITKARLYITAHGLYEAYLNSSSVGDQLFTPGWTSYNKRLQYQTYDVTRLLQKGENAIAVRLGDGWFRGQFDSKDRWNKVYGTNTALLFQLEITYKNGEIETITSDENWKASTGAIVMSGIYDGEIQDARLEKTGWMQTGYDDSTWNSVRKVNHSKSRLISTEGVPVRKMESVTTKKIFDTPKGELVADLGQNLVGWVQLKIKGKRGDTITLHHAEVLDQDGNFYTANLRTADQKVQYILKDSKEQILEPHFTFQGFRYVKIEGVKEPVSPNQVTGIAIYSDMERTGNFECSNALINQLQQNIQWGQRGNFLDVPTDCPQRDERMGWTGDAQAFASTACFNFNSASFYTKWLQDLRMDQLENGSVPWVVPKVLNGHGSAGWGDAATIVPWTIYSKYGDQRILERQYESMKHWIAYLEDLAEENYLVQKGKHFGDWLFFIHPTKWNVKPGHTDHDFLATAFFAYSAELTLKTARVLGREEDVERYKKLLSNIKIAFQEEFLTPSGRLSPHSQTAYTLALAFDLLPEDKRPLAAAYLVQNIKDRQYHLSTGFLGTPHLCHVLSSNGYTEVAYKLLLQEKYPSWLYPVTKGATTIWERWDGIKPDGSFQDVKMNSFNHYAYGAIGDWMYRAVAGIEAIEPGYKHILIHPHPTDKLSFAKASYESMYGPIQSGWKLENNQLNLKVSIPPNTRSTIVLQSANLNNVLESKEGVETSAGISSAIQQGEDVILEVGSGNYFFSYHLTKVDE